MTTKIDVMKEQAKAEAQAIARGKGTPQILRAAYDIDSVIVDQVENNPEFMDILMNLLVRGELCDIARDKTLSAGAGVKGDDCPLYTKYVGEVYGIQLKDEKEMEEIHSRLPRADRISRKLLYDCAPDLAAKYDNIEHRTPVPMNKAYASVLGGMALIKQMSIVFDILAERQDIKDHYLE